MKIAIGSDHGGFALKAALKESLADKNIVVPNDASPCVDASIQASLIAFLSKNFKQCFL